MKNLNYILASILSVLTMHVSVDCIDVFAAQSLKYESVNIQLRWSHQFQFAGYYAALEKGYYADEGLEVTLAEAAAGKDRVQPVLDGTAQYGIGDSGILKLRSDGQPLVVLAQIFQHSPNILITRRDSNILGTYELTGKTVMLSKEPASSAAVRAMLLETLGSLDRVTVLPHTRDAEIIDGKADAVAGYLSNEPFHYRQKGLLINIIDPRSYGIDFYGVTPRLSWPVPQKAHTNRGGQEMRTGCGGSHPGCIGLPGCVAKFRRQHRQSARAVRDHVS